MRHNSNSRTDFSNESYPSVNIPVWTIPDIPSVLSNNDVDLSPYSGFNHLPPNYFDISIVPNNAVLHYNEVVPFTEPSKAKIDRKNEGPYSLDPLIDSNSDQLWLYFMTYLNEKPFVSINIHGYHMQVKNIGSSI
jgi:hypothetical protein